jgi:hypothetical protein
MRLESALDPDADVLSRNSAWSSHRQGNRTQRRRSLRGLPPNGEAEGPRRSAVQATRAHTLFPRPRSQPRSPSRTPPAIVRGRLHRSHCARTPPRAQTEAAGRGVAASSPTSSAHGSDPERRVFDFISQLSMRVKMSLVATSNGELERPRRSHAGASIGLRSSGAASAPPDHVSRTAPSEG